MSSAVRRKRLSGGADGEVADSSAAESPPAAGRSLRHWAKRCVAGCGMMAGFAVVVYLGPLALVALVAFLQLSCTCELLRVCHAACGGRDLPLCRTVSCSFLLAANFYFYGDCVIDHFGDALRDDRWLNLLPQHHRLISYSLYCCAFALFVLQLQPGLYQRQFAMAAWTHVAMAAFSGCGSCIVRNVLHGAIWMTLSSTLVFFNDIVAFFVGSWLGRTPLLQLSPKKTWEGFLGAGAATLALGLAMGHVLLQYDSLVCPLRWDRAAASFSVSCQRPADAWPQRLAWQPFHWHSAAIATFVSTLGPFGGFFASGVKRALGLKDFSGVIPGHGGFIDRFDCHFFVGPFVTAYILSVAA